MPIEDQIALCSEHFQRWKGMALSAQETSETKRCMEKAFFWLELQSAFIVLSAVEQTKGKDAEIKRKILEAKSNLSKKLVDYADETLKEYSGE